MVKTPSSDRSEFVRYLAAKRSIDDRSLNRFVFEQLRHTLTDPSRSSPLSILEVGCGAGAMVERLTEWGFLGALPEGSTYLGIDADPSLVVIACGLAGMRNGANVGFEAVTLEQYSEGPAGSGSHDLVIAHAVLDLLDLNTALQQLHTILRPGGLGWFTLNFDGVTHFEPPVRRDLDHTIEALYHDTMDRRVVDGTPSGDSQTGRHLLSALPMLGFSLLAAGASDWIVHPVEGAYLNEDAYFLRYIVETVHNALQDAEAIDPKDLALWRKTRHTQIDNAQLAYVAHQIDFLVRTTPQESELEIL